MEIRAKQTIGIEALSEHDCSLSFYCWGYAPVHSLSGASSVSVQGLAMCVHGQLWKAERPNSHPASMLDRGLTCGRF